MQAISKGLEKVIQELSTSENDGPISEIFCKVFKQSLMTFFFSVHSFASLSYQFVYKLLHQHTEPLSCTNI